MRAYELRRKYKDVKITICRNVIDDIVKKCNCFEFGARQIDKIISSYIESTIIDKIIDGCVNIRINKLKELNYN